MSARVGLELGPELIRAVRLDSWGSRVQTLELHWDPAAPAEAFAVLGESLGKVGRLAVTVDLAFLFVKQVRLPPLPAGEKRRILTLEPERFFPVRAEQLVLAVRGEDNLVFAARTSVLGGWLEALEKIAPVDLVEPAPVSLARALDRAAPGNATILFEEKDEGVGIANIGAGRVRGMRRVHGDPGELAEVITAAGQAGGKLYLRPLNGNQSWRPAEGVGTESAGELPSVAGVGPPHLAAYGAVLGIGGNLLEAMLPADFSRRITRRRLRSLVLASIAGVLALVFAILSLDQFRARTLRRLDAEIARVRVAAEAALALEREREALYREAQAVSTMERDRIDPVPAIAGLTRRIPEGTYLQALRGTGVDWQIDGYAREAAPLVARLEEDPKFEDVHFLTATSRIRVGGRPYESFSIAFRLVSAP